MPVNVLMPALSPTMTEGTLAKWHKKEGDEVAAGDVIAEIETDKATMEFEAVDEGRLGRILVPEGSEGIPVNTPIAILLEEGEDEGDLEKVPAPAAPPAAEEKEEAKKREAAAAEPAAPAQAPRRPEAAKEAPAAPRAGLAAAEEVPPAPPAPAGAEGRRIFASPLARRMAKQAGLDLTRLSGTGPHGRIVKSDIEAAVERGVAAPAAAPAEAPAAAPAAAGPAPKELADAYGPAYEERPLSTLRKTIARRMVESKQAVPHFYLTIDVELDELLALRKQLNDKAATAGEETKLSVNDILVRACALALVKAPAANCAYNNGTALMFQSADIAVAVATEGGLVAPVVRRAESKGLAQISREMKDLGARAREGKLKPEEYQGGGFTLSNLGMYGIKQFEAIINPPQACILAVGAGEQRPVVQDGALAVATVMSCTLSVDHRVVDGAIGAEFLAALKKLVEDPLTMLL